MVRDDLDYVLCIHCESQVGGAECEEPLLLHLDFANLIHIVIYDDFCIFRHFRSSKI